MGDGLPHGLGRSSHWRECYAAAADGSISLQTWQQRECVIASNTLEIGC